MDPLFLRCAIEPEDKLRVDGSWDIDDTVIVEVLLDQSINSVYLDRLRVTLLRDHLTALLGE